MFYTGFKYKYIPILVILILIAVNFVTSQGAPPVGPCRNCLLKCCTDQKACGNSSSCNDDYTACDKACSTGDCGPFNYNYDCTSLLASASSAVPSPTSPVVPPPSPAPVSTSQLPPPPPPVSASQPPPPPPPPPSPLTTTITSTTSTTSTSITTSTSTSTSPLPSPPPSPSPSIGSQLVPSIALTCASSNDPICFPSGNKAIVTTVTVPLQETPKGSYSITTTTITSYIAGYTTTDSRGSPITYPPSTLYVVKETIAGTTQASDSTTIIYNINGHGLWGIIMSLAIVLGTLIFMISA